MRAAGARIADVLGAGVAIVTRTVARRMRAVARRGVSGVVVVGARDVVIAEYVRIFENVLAAFRGVVAKVVRAVLKIVAVRSRPLTLSETDFASANVVGARVVVVAVRIKIALVGRASAYLMEYAEAGSGVRLAVTSPAQGIGARDVWARHVGGPTFARLGVAPRVLAESR